MSIEFFLEIHFSLISKSKSLYSCPVSTSGVVPDFPFTFTGFPETGFRIQPPVSVTGALGGRTSDDRQWRESSSEVRLTIKSQAPERRKSKKISLSTAAFDKQHSSAEIGRARAMEGIANKATAALAKRECST